jgi:hypothetical protein
MTGLRRPTRTPLWLVPTTNHPSRLTRNSRHGDPANGRFPATNLNRGLAGPCADGRDGQLPGNSSGRRCAGSHHKPITRTGPHRGRRSRVGGNRSDCDAVQGLRRCGLATSGASRASHRPAAPAGAGWHSGQLRPPPPGTGHAVPPGHCGDGVEPCRDLGRVGRAAALPEREGKSFGAHGVQPTRPAASRATPASVVSFTALLAVLSAR